LPWSIGRNITLPSVSRYAGSMRLLNVREESEEAGKLSKQLAVKATSIADLVLSLSGGNQQKVVIAKLLSSRTKILIMDEPTKGVDVGSKSQIYQFLCDLAGQGFGILVISSEMLEVINISDNILVMREGRLADEIPRAEVTQERILTAAMPLEKRA